MKAIVWTKYGPPEGLELGEVEKPVPKDNEILIRIHATTVTAGDCEMRSLTFQFVLALIMRIYSGLRKPKRITVLGQELAGEVEAVGRAVSRFKPGDAVFAGTGMTMGAYAEYICLPAEPSDADAGIVETKPANLSFGEAAAVPAGGLEAYDFLSRAQIRKGEKVLINGSGGSIGTVAIQLASQAGAEVTAVDSAAKHEMLRSIGADHVIDYASEDFADRIDGYDVIFDVVGKRSLKASLRALAENGRYLAANPRFFQLLRREWTVGGGRKVMAGASGRTARQLADLKALIEAGKIAIVIDRHYPLEEAAEAHRYVESGQKKGNVILDVVK